MQCPVFRIYAINSLVIYQEYGKWFTIKRILDWCIEFMPDLVFPMFKHWVSLQEVPTFVDSFYCCEGRFLGKEPWDTANGQFDFLLIGDLSNRAYPAFS